MERWLDEGDVSDDPMVELARWVEAAKAGGVAEWDAMVVATADAGGRPSARVVLLRGLDERGLRFYTNYDSHKGADLAANPRAAVVLHWREQGRQVRVSGAVSRLTLAESLEYWRTRAVASRLSAWASHQSEVVADRATLEANYEGVRQRITDDDVPLPPFWGGYLVTPEEVELWQRRDHRLHDRIHYRRVPAADPAGPGTWVMERLQP